MGSPDPIDPAANFLRGSANPAAPLFCSTVPTTAGRNNKPWCYNFINEIIAMKSSKSFWKTDERCWNVCVGQQVYKKLCQLLRMCVKVLNANLPRSTNQLVNLPILVCMRSLCCFISMIIINQKCLPAIDHNNQVVGVVLRQFVLWDYHILYCQQFVKSIPCLFFLLIVTAVFLYYNIEDFIKMVTIIFCFSVILKYRMPSFITICPQMRPCEGI